MNNKKILLIGGTGALGKTLIKLYQNTNDIKIFSRDEHKQVHLLSSDWVNKDNVSDKLSAKSSKSDNKVKSQKET
jgi:FlaA1/EpsC-like NDP-sugar epimerase